MSTAIAEGTILVEFGDGWRVTRWDATPPGDPAPYPYREGIQKLGGDLDGRSESTKALDVVAVSPTKVLCLLEIKDFRSDRSGGGEPRSLASEGRWRELPLEVALKVRDTLAGIFGVVQRGSPASIAEWLAPVLGRPIFVCAWIAQDTTRSGESREKRKIRDGEMRQNLRRRLAWLTDSARAVVMLDPFDPQTFPRELTGVVVSSLSR